MTTPNTGLQNSKIVGRLLTTGSTRQTFVTQTYVNSQIEQKFDPVPVVDINITNSGVSIFGVSGTNRTVVDIGLCTTLGDLTDVNFAIAPIVGNYLVYNGTSWDVGNGVSTFSITDLTNWSGNLVPNGFLRVNANGTSVAATVTNIVSGVIGGQGIAITDSGTDNTVKVISMDAGGVVTTMGDASDNTFVIANSNLETRRIRKDRIALSSFNTQDFVRQTDITAHVDPTGVSQSILRALHYGTAGVSIVLDTTDIMIGVCGVLPISKGGTGSGTSEGARENLGLVISNLGTSSPDIVGYSQSKFLRLTGDNMKLTPSGVSNPAPSLINNFGGTGYTDGTCTRKITGYTAHPEVFVTATASGGSITTVSGVCVFPYITTNGNYFLQDTDGGGSGASIRIDLDYSYLTFGASPSVPHDDLDTYLGIRYNTDYKQLEFKGTSPGASTGWNLLTNKFGVSGLTDVSGGSYPYADTSILIFNSSTKLWSAHPVTGTGTISHTGGLSITNFHAYDINLGGIGVSRILDLEMSQLSGINTSEPIQEQLDSKIQVNTNLTNGDLIMFDETSLGVSNFTKVVPNPTSETAYTYLKQYEVAPGNSIPKYENLYHGFESFTSVLSSPNNQFCFTNEGTCMVQKSSLQNTNQYLIGKNISGICPGIDINSIHHTLELNFNTLNGTSLLDTTDLIAVQKPVGVGLCTPKKIAVSDFITGLTGSGICGSGGTLQVAVDTGVCPSQLEGPKYDGRLAYFYGTTTLGPSILGVYYGTCWYGTCLTAFS